MGERALAKMSTSLKTLSMYYSASIYQYSLKDVNDGYPHKYTDEEGNKHLCPTLFLLRSDQIPPTTYKGATTVYTSEVICMAAYLLDVARTHFNERGIEIVLSDINPTMFGICHVSVAIVNSNVVYKYQLVATSLKREQIADPNTRVVLPKVTPPSLTTTTAPVPPPPPNQDLDDVK